MDWKDALKNLMDSDSLPAADAEPAEQQQEAPSAPAPQRLTIVTERKGHRGKTVTIVEGFTCDDDILADIASRLKRHLGTGGSSRCGEILVQGDRRADVEAWLRREKLMK